MAKSKKKEINIKIIVIVIISVLVIGGLLTWGFLTNWGQEKKSKPVKYTVPVEIKKGSDTIKIKNPASHGFKIGQIIEIGNKETRTIVGFGKFGSLILNLPIEFDHLVNTVITVIKEPIKKDFKVDNCGKYNEDLTCQKCDDLYYLEDNKCKEYTYTSDQITCNNQRGVFTAGTEISDQTCVECTTNQWFESNKCNEYSYTGTEDECKKVDRQIFIKGTETSDQKCVQCDTTTDWISKDICTTYRTTCEDGKWLDIKSGTVTSDRVCYDIIPDLDTLKSLIKDKQYNHAKYGPINTWKLDSKITDLNSLFNINFNQDISGWDVSNVENMKNMFKNCLWFNRDITKWDVSNVTNMEGMFNGASSFNQDINTKIVTRENGTTYKAWDVSKVTNMEGMFKNAVKFNQDISEWDVSNVTNMEGMFNNATKMNKFEYKKPK